MSVSPQIPSDRDLELLSAYLDGELTDREKEKLEQRLAHETGLRAVLDDLRETVAMVSDLPRLKAPRNFTLDPAVYARRASWWQRVFTFQTALQLSGALGAAASILLIVLALVVTQGKSDKSSMSAERPDSSQIAMQPTLAADQPEETALAYASDDLLQTTIAAQNAYYATLTAPPAPAQTESETTLSVGEESFQDASSATEETQEMAVGAVAPAEALTAPENEEPSIMMAAPGAYPPVEAQDAVGAAAAPPPVPSTATTADQGMREEPRDFNGDEGDTDGVMANVASTPETEIVWSATPTLIPTTQAEKSQSAATPVTTGSARHQTSPKESSSYWWLAGIGLVTLFFSLMLFVWSRRRARL